jgi:hypothetical protein
VNGFASKESIHIPSGKTGVIHFIKKRELKRKNASG